MKPIKITAELFDGRINSNDGILNIDSILGLAWMQENFPDELLNKDLRRGELRELHLPLFREPDGRFSSSCGFYVQHHERIEYYHRRFDEYEAGRHLDFGGKRGKINITAGSMKAYRIPQVIRSVGDIEFYAVGERGEVERLLTTYITNIGKKGAQGQGAVKEWVIELWPEDWSTVGPYGLMRPTPFDGTLPRDGNTYQIRRYGIKPPYWLPENEMVCMIPNVRRKPDETI